MTWCWVGRPTFKSDFGLKFRSRKISPIETAFSITFHLVFPGLGVVSLSMIVKLYNQCFNKLKNEQKNVPLLKEALIKLKREAPKSSSVQELEQKIAQWSEPL